MFTSNHRWIVALVVVFSWAIMGCETSLQVSVDALPPEQLDKLRDQFVAAEEPGDSLGVIELRESFDSIREPAAEPDPADETQTDRWINYDDVVVVGKVGGKKPEEVDAADFPVVENEAVFYIVDPAFDEQEGGHDHGEGHDCPFCNKKAVEAQAIVRVLGDDGQPLPVCAKALFDLEPNTLVVVSGKAEVQLDTLVITAREIFVRR